MQQTDFHRLSSLAIDEIQPVDVTNNPPWPEFRQQIVELAREFEPTEKTIRAWIQQADRDEGRDPNGLSTDERDERRQLRRENRQLKLEREILAEATAWFARETDSTPRRSTSS